MQVINQTKAVCNFKNTCHKYFSDIEFPLLGDFSYGEIIFQTNDGLDFYIAELIENKTFNFIVEHLKADKDLRRKKDDPQKLLLLVADKPNCKEFTANYPICPVCKSRQHHFNGSVRTSLMELAFVTWNKFEHLTDMDKME